MSEENPYTAPQADLQAPVQIGGTPGVHNYASLGERLLGKIIDGLIMVPVTLILVFILGMVFTKAAPTDSNVMSALGRGAGFGVIGNLVLAVLGMAIYIAVQWTFWKASSQSIGKKVMKTQVVNMDGTPASVETIAFKRYAAISILSLVPLVGGLVSLVNALLVFRADRNCLHDDLAKTRVIKLPVSN